MNKDKLKPFNLESYLKLALNNSEEYLIDSSDLEIIKDILEIIKNNRKKKVKIEVKSTDVPLFKDPTELLLTSKVSTEEAKDEILILLRVKQAVKDEDKVKDEDNDKVSASDENIIEIPKFELADGMEVYEDKLKQIYEKCGFKITERVINGVTIREQYPHEKSLKSIKLNKIDYTIKNNCHPDYYKSTYIKAVLEKMKKSEKHTTLGLTEFCEYLNNISRDDSYTFPYSCRKDIDVDTILDLLKKTKSEEEEKDNEYEVNISEIYDCPLLHCTSFKFTISDKYRDDLLKVFDTIGKVSINKKAKVAKDVIEIRKRKTDESVEDYEAYLKDTYKDLGIYLGGGKNRLLYPHELYCRNNTFKNNGKEYLINFEDGTSYKDYLEYYKNDYLKARNNTNIRIVTSKKGFLEDFRKIPKKNGKRYSLINGFVFDRLNEILDIISEDNTSEITNDETNDISFSGQGFIPFINRKYKFKVDNETLDKLKSLKDFDKYFSDYRVVKSNEPIKDIVRIKKRRGESIEEYEAYLESIYAAYPSLQNRDSNGKIIPPRKKFPHELLQRNFVVNDRIIEIQYGNPDDPEDMEEYNNDKDRYISSVRTFYEDYYRTFRTKIDSVPKIEKNKEDFIEVLKGLIGNKDDISVVNVKENELEQLIRLLSDDHTKQDAVNNAYFLKVSGANLLHNSNFVFQFTVNEDTYNESLHIINKYFSVIKHGHKNTDKNYYIKKKLKERLDNIPERRDAIINKQKELIEKALDMLNFDATKETDLVELVGAVITRSKKDEFLDIMQQIERTGFKLDDFVPIEMPPKYDGSNPRRYERDLVDRYKFVRPEFYDEESKDMIFDNSKGSRAPYPHEMFKWTEDCQPSISPSNNESDYYRYYVDYGNNALFKRKKVTKKENIKDKPLLFGKLRDKLSSIREKLADAPVLSLIFNNDVLRAMYLENESYRDVNVATASYNAFKEKLYKYSIIGGGIIFFTPVTLFPGLAGIVGVTMGHQLIDIIIRIKNCYDYIKVSKCEEYNSCLEKLVADIAAIEKEVMAIEDAPVTKSSASRKNDLLENLKAKIVAYRKTQKKFNEAFSKLSKKTINDWRDEEEKFRDFYQGLIDRHPEAASRGGIRL